MAKKSEETIVDVEEVYSKSEQYIVENKKSLSLIIGVAIVIVAGYFAYTQLYIKPLEVEAGAAMWKAEEWFEIDSFNLAINGNDEYYGFIDLADQYSATNAGNLCNYYIGVSYLNMGDFPAAIEYLDKFDSDDAILGPMAAGAMGHAYLEQHMDEDAVSAYERAANMQDNEFTTPMFLKLAGDLHAQLGDHDKALKLYDRIKKEYPESAEAQDIDKYYYKSAALTD